MDVHPCPFCGCGEIELAEVWDVWGDRKVFMECEQCGACGPWQHDHADCETYAQRLWNGRKEVE